MVNNLIQWPTAKYWDKQWNPVIGCKPCSLACEHCYAAAWAKRFGQSFEPHESSQTRPPRKGVVFCGNMNSHLSYHLCYPYDCEYLRGERWLMCRTKWEIEACIKKWHSQLDADTVERGLGSLAKKARCRPVKMVVSWEPVTKGTSPCK